MRVRIDFNARQEAERILVRVMKRRNFGAEVRDALADHLEDMLTNEFRKAGITATNEHKD